MHPLRICLIASIWLAASALTVPVSAQQARAPSAEAPPPPKLERLEEGEQPAVTIRPPGGKATITEQRAPGGKRTDVKVTTGKSTYRVQPSDQPGNAQVGDGQSIVAKPAKWEVMTFDLNRGKQIAQEPTEQQAVPPPPAAAKTPETPAPTKK